MANIDIGGRLHSTATGNVVAGANEILDDSKGKKQSTINAEVDAALEGKQDEIADLSTIRSGAAAGATAYQKPGTGIPATDMASEVQTSLGKADSAYQKPSGGIPKTDLESGVQDSLELADSAVQADPIGSIVPPVDPSEFATKEEVEELEAKVDEVFQDLDGDTFYISDPNGNVVAKIDANGVKAVAFIDKDGNIVGETAIQYTEQTLTDAQKGQARTNIGAIGAAELGQVSGDVEDLAEEIDEMFPIRDGDTLYVCDPEGNVVTKVNADGVKAIAFIDRNGNILQSYPQIRPFYEDRFAFADEDGNVIFLADKNGVKSLTLQKNDWFKKSVGFYGDSITEINNGNFHYPFGINDKYLPLWANMVGQYFAFAKVYGRGIGAQYFTWKNDGGTVSWLSPSGYTLGRAAGFTYDDFDGESYPAGVTAEMEQSGDAIRVRGCFCSWLRIKNSFPEEIKDTVDAVVIMGGTNDFQASFSNPNFTNINTEPTWVANSATDPEWAEDTDYYNGGDFNIDCFRGAIASTIMKFALWMPKALIILATPLSGNNKTDPSGYGNVTSFETDANGNTMEDYADVLKAVAHQFSFPCIDIFGNTMITIFNREGVIDDQFHPYTNAGRDLLARAMASGLKGILPRF